tara:strand:+ start:558 stop:689 length:132 start_codon:yes stop_codon:yes gene_type:complete
MELTVPPRGFIRIVASNQLISGLKEIVEMKWRLVRCSFRDIEI